MFSLFNCMFKEVYRIRESQKLQKFDLKYLLTRFYIWIEPSFPKMLLKLNQAKIPALWPRRRKKITTRCNFNRNNKKRMNKNINILKALLKEYKMFKYMIPNKFQSLNVGFDNVKKRGLWVQENLLSMAYLIQFSQHITNYQVALCNERLKQFK